MHELLDDFVENAEDDAGFANIDLETISPRNRPKVSRFLEDYEEKFFEGMRETIEKRRRQTK